MSRVIRSAILLASASVGEGGSATPVRAIGKGLGNDTGDCGSEYRGCRGTGKREDEEMSEDCGI